MNRTLWTLRMNFIVLHIIFKNTPNHLKVGKIKILLLGPIESFAIFNINLLSYNFISKVA